MVKTINPIASFRFLAQACIGVLISVFLALLFVRLTLPVDGRPAEIPQELLAWNLQNVLLKPREKALYLATLSLGFFGAYMSTARLWRIHWFPLCVLLCASMPLINYLARHLLTKNGSIFIPMILIAISILFILFANKRSIPVKSVSVNSLPFQFRWKPYLFLLGLISIILLPSSFKRVAVNIGIDLHIASFIAGPALYFLNKHLVPGLDYFSQYSVGMGWVFSYMLGKDIQNTMVHYVYLVIFSIWFFYAQLIYLLHWLYRSWLSAALISLLSLILLFHTTNHFFDPSSTVLRYPLLGLCAWLLARWINQQYSSLNTLSLAFGIACSIFLNTETGLIITLAVIGATLLSSSRFYLVIIPLLRLIIISFLFFGLLVFMIFGKPALQWNFLNYLLQPLWIYGKIGFGGWSISWTMKDFNWFYNLLSPAIAIATVAMIARAAKHHPVDHTRLAVLAYFALSGLMMLAKYINMSIVALWQMNSLGLLVVLGYWLSELARQCHSKVISIPFSSRIVPVSLIVWIASFSLAIFYVTSCNDERVPSVYAFQSWQAYPSFIKSIFKTPQGCGNFDCIAHLPSKKDIELIKQRTKPGEQVAIIDLYDWSYLVGAHRPPLMFFLPSIDIFTKHQLIGSMKALQKARYVFLPKNSQQKPLIDMPLKEFLQTTLEQSFIFDADGERLTAWRRKNEE